MRSVNAFAIHALAVRKFLVVALIAMTVTLGTATLGFGQESKESAAKASSAKKSKFADFKKTVEGAKKHEGLFNLYHKDDRLYAEIKPSMYNKELIAPMAIARGMASAGTPLNFGDEWILYFRRVGDKIQLVRKNIHYQAPKGTPLEKAVEQNFTDSVLKALPIVSMSPSGAPLVDLSQIFFSDFAQLGIGSIDRSRTSWHQVKAFKNNIELQVETTYSSGRYGYFGGNDGVVDRRGVTIIMHYSLTKRPPSGYKPRFADQRVGHFISATKDFGSKNPDTTFVRRINRWRLEKSNSKAKLSPPKQQLIWWVEDTVPHEYRPYVEEGILEWNKAFEKIGFRNAIGVRWQADGDEFDPEDTNYCTFRWITTASTFAMSGLRADPITGEMIDGDVIFDASWVRYWKDDYALMMGAPVPTANGENAQLQPGALLGVGEVISPMMAVKQGYGLPFTPQSYQLNRQFFHQGETEEMPVLIPSSHGPLHTLLSRRLAGGNFNACQCAVAKRHEYRLAAMALAAAAAADDDHADGPDSDNADGDNEDGDNADADNADGDHGDSDKEDSDKEDSDKDDADKKDKAAAEKEEKEKQDIELPEELLAQAIKEVVMHEVGHSLGLRHNFKASTMLSLDEINDTEITRKKGLVGSVMDYNPLNISRKGEKQGDYATTTIGPYDYWAIEYAYKPVSNAKELKKIAARSPEAELTYATDEDLYSSNDPRVNVYDLGDDPLAYVMDRVDLAAELLEGIDEKVIRDGESWARLRRAFSVLVAQYGNAAYTATSYIGGQHISRDSKGAKAGRDPIVPVEGAKQREALDYLVDTILSDEAFEFSPQLLRRLTSEHWYHWGSGMSFGSDTNVYDLVLRIQQIVLRHCFDPGVLKRLQNQQLMVEQMDEGENEPLQIGEVFRTLTDSIWSELEEAEDELECSTIRRNLQRDHLSRLNRLVLGNRRGSSGDLFGFIMFYGGSSNYPADARSLARLHLIELAERIEVVLDNDDLE
ncbi:MAG: zinc-dependent metalloprotease, partial [Bythopirellula sp.]